MDFKEEKENIFTINHNHHIIHMVIKKIKLKALM